MMNDPPKSCFNTRRIPPRSALPRTGNEVGTVGSAVANAILRMRRHGDVVPHVPGPHRVAGSDMR